MVVVFREADISASTRLKRTRIVIADDHAFIIEGMAAMLEKTYGFEIAGRAANGIEAIALIKRLQPDCALLDLSMPGANGFETYLEARRWSPATRFAIVTGNPSPAIFSQLLDAGVSGIFLKSAAPDEICRGIADICAGRNVLPPEIAEVMRDGTAGGAMTAREIEVLQAIARGKSNNQIAEHLGVSPKTVDTHRTNLMKKLGVHSTATLLVKAMKEGLIDITGTE